MVQPDRGLRRVCAIDLTGIDHVGKMPDVHIAWDGIYIAGQRFCTDCGKLIDAGAIFCLSCGLAISALAGERVDSNQISSEVNLEFLGTGIEAMVWGILGYLLAIGIAILTSLVFSSIGAPTNTLGLFLTTILLSVFATHQFSRGTAFPYVAGS